MLGAAAMIVRVKARNRVFIGSSSFFLVSTKQFKSIFD